MFPKIVLTFHCLNKLFQWSQKFCKFLAFSLKFQKFFSITRTIFFLIVGQNIFGNKIPIIFSTFPTEKNRQKKLHNNNNKQRPQASRLKQTRRLKFAIDQTLRLEYTVPLAKDFQVTLSGGGALIRHKVAFFAEDEAAAVVSLLDSRGVQVIRKRGYGAERKRGSNFVS